MAQNSSSLIQIIRQYWFITQIINTILQARSFCKSQPFSCCRWVGLHVCWCCTDKRLTPCLTTAASFAILSAKTFPNATGSFPHMCAAHLQTAIPLVNNTASSRFCKSLVCSTGFPVEVVTPRLTHCTTKKCTVANVYCLSVYIVPLQLYTLPLKLASLLLKQIWNMLVVLHR